MTNRGRPWRRLACGLALSALAAGCAETQSVVHTAKRLGKAESGERERAEGVYKIGNPYQIKGVWYYPAVDYDYDESGIASWYGDPFHGRKTANGETYDMNALTAAHKTLPMPSAVRVTNLDNGRSMVLRINDRGPYARGRIIDLSRRSAQLLGFYEKGTARVRVRILADESRAIAARMTGKTVLAAADSPITVDKVPAPTVASDALPPPPGASAAPARPRKHVSPSARRTTAAASSKLSPVNGTVIAEPIEVTQIYIQAGAFSQFTNANQVRARLSSVGPVRISPVLVDGRDLFRVRLGPILSVGEADRLLERIIGAGYPQARVIVD